jgi:hypothetical protein
MPEDYINNIIVKYKITDEQEKRALKLYYYWMTYRKKIFPDMLHGKFNENKDPRNSLIFKYCYKLQRETSTTLEEKDYENYIRAQLIVLKHFSKKYDTEISIDANVITGEKAWKRWKSFRARLRITKNNSVNEYISFPSLEKVTIEFNKTKNFLLENMSEINEENIENNINNIIIWFNFRKISPYFIVFNKKINSIYTIEDIKKIFKIDPLLYKERFSDIIKEVYENVFGKI